MKNFLLFTVVLAFYTHCFSQGTCGSYVSNAQNMLEKSITIASLSSSQSLPQLNRDLCLSIFIVNDTTQSSGVALADIDAAIDRLNSYFAPISLKFHRCSLIYIENYQFDNLVQEKNEKELTALYADPFMINLYVVSKIFDRFSKPVKGFTYMPADNKNFIFITKADLNTSEIGHQFGHFFNLYHTHETNFGAELVSDVTSCGNTGDLCCDTEADPGLSSVIVNNNCLYIGSLKDVNNQFYTPSVKNLMSFSRNECRCFFSQMQYLRVIYAVNNLKKSLK
jgi:hypothetical protein